MYPMSVTAEVSQAPMSSLNVARIPEYPLRFGLSPPWK
eukprot:CAMPEP_0184123662 /NCGR_PEP_ID=MMETSP0974-20121125/24117_1 /TAXON_ID=483370 /ORGANISM="non described non described, Strain CCMP2097" /LENGTH=37 /DNA_ID= /DNA_START= /DNA_END= /DNA_ORIENTATION=